MRVALCAAWLLACTPAPEVATARITFAGLPSCPLPEGLPIYRHYGLYAYRVAFLRRYPALPPAPIERFEALEQLRALWHGERIVVEVTQATPAPGIDTPEDLVRVRAMLERMPHRD